MATDIDAEAWRTAFTAETRRQVPARCAHDTTYVIEIDGERAGRLRLVRPPDFRELAGIQLLPAHQGNGLGTYLIEQFLVDARDQGLPARVSVQRDNPRARGLYERLGFVEVAADDRHPPSSSATATSSWSGAARGPSARPARPVGDERPGLEHERQRRVLVGAGDPHPLAHRVTRARGAGLALPRTDQGAHSLLGSLTTRAPAGRRRRSCPRCAAPGTAASGPAGPPGGGPAPAP